MRGLAALPLLGLFGCNEPALVECGTYLCPVDYACSPSGCRAPDAVMACVGGVSAASCEVAPSLQIELPAGDLAPAGFSWLDVTIHRQGTVETLSARADATGAFDLGPTAPDFEGLEVTLRDDVGSIRGYGQTSAAGSLARGDAAVIAVRPLLYLTGLARDSASKPYTRVPPTYLDLATPGAVERRLDRATNQVVAAGSLFLLEQQVERSGMGVGPIEIRPVSPLDHAIGQPLATLDLGALFLASGGEAGVIALATSTGTYAFDTRDRTVRMISQTAASTLVVAETRVASLTAGATVGPCENTVVDVRVDAQLVATGMFADLAADGDRLFTLGCDGAISEIVDGRLVEVYGRLGAASALAVVNANAYVAVTELSPLRMALLRVPVDGSRVPPVELARTELRQGLVANDFPEVRRDLPAATVSSTRLEIGGGGALVGLATITTHDGPPIEASNFPAMTLEVHEVRVFDARSGGTVLRYRANCEGSFSPGPFDIPAWSCATETGQVAPAMRTSEHRIDAMIFPHGRR